MKTPSRVLTLCYFVVFKIFAELIWERHLLCLRFMMYPSGHNFWGKAGHLFGLLQFNGYCGSTSNSPKESSETVCGSFNLQELLLVNWWNTIETRTTLISRPRGQRRTHCQHLPWRNSKLNIWISQIWCHTTSFLQLMTSSDVHWNVIPIFIHRHIYIFAMEWNDNNRWK